MNVCMFVYNPCETDPRVAKEARTLAALGHDVTLLALLEPGTAAVERRDGYTIVRIVRNPFHRRLVKRLLRRSSGRALASRTGVAQTGNGAGRRRGADAPAWLTGLHRSLMLLDYYRRAYRLARSVRPDRVHAHDLLTLPVGVLSAWRSGVPLIYDAHELYPEIGTLSRRERRVWALVERLLIRRAHRVITVCDSIRDELRRRYGVDATVVLNVPPRPDSTANGAGALRRRAGLEGSDAPVVVYTGGFAPHRGLHDLVRAAAAFDAGVLVLMGWGRLEGELQSLAASLGLERRVRIVPPVAPSELLRYTADADIGVIPYEPVGLNNRFATPNKLFEFMAVGLPIVCSRLPELVRFVEGEQVGLTFEPGSPSGLAAAVNRLLADPPLRDAMRARALAASRQLCWERESEKLTAIYEPAT